MGAQGRLVLAAAHHGQYHSLVPRAESLGEDMDDADGASLTLHGLNRMLPFALEATTAPATGHWQLKPRKEAFEGAPIAYLPPSPHTNTHTHTHTHRHASPLHHGMAR